MVQARLRNRGIRMLQQFWKMVSRWFNPRQRALRAERRKIREMADFLDRNSKLGGGDKPAS